MFAYSLVYLYVYCIVCYAIIVVGTKRWWWNESNR